MGRPRKRRREDGADEDTDLPGESKGHAITLDDPWASSSFAQFGTITPPQGQDPNVSNDTVDEDSRRLSQHDFGGPDLFGVSPGLDLE
jgi:hypothetical protein